MASDLLQPNGRDFSTCAPAAADQATRMMHSQIERVSLLASAAPAVDVWWCNLDRPSADVARLGELLSANEKVRADRFGQTELRDRYIVGRASLRMLLGKALALSPIAVPLRTGEHGRPELDGESCCDFNVSHTNNAAVIALARSTGRRTRVGVDIERRDRILNADRLALKFSSPDERRSQAALSPIARRKHFLRVWTYKEAMSKATGDGLLAPFRYLDVRLEDAPKLTSGPPPYVPERWTLHPLAVPSPYFAALAIWTP